LQRKATWNWKATLANDAYKLLEENICFIVFDNGSDINPNVRFNDPTMTRFKYCIPIAASLFVLCSIHRPVTAVPIPVALSFDVPPSEVSGVWWLARLGTLVGPTPAIFLYRRAWKLFETCKPAARARVREIGDLVRRKLSAPLESMRIILTTDDDFSHLDWMTDTSIWPTLGLHQKYPHLKHPDASGASTDKNVRSVVSAIVADPRLKNQRIRESRIMLGDAKAVDIRSLYNEYRAGMELTLRVMQEKIDLAMLDPEEELEVQRLVTADMGGWP
jgi:hypothetical protein